VAFTVTLLWFLDLVTPLMTGELAYGQVGYYEYQEGKDVLLVILAVLLVLNVALIALLHVSYKKRLRALGPRPGGMPGKWKRWLYSL
jgi:hypothetical protein